MRTFITVSLFLVSAAATAAEKDTRLFEMRVYYAAPGKLDALLARFRDHTCKLFEKHGMTNIGYWVPGDNKDNKLVYVLAYKDREAHDKAWKAFVTDPDWIKAYRESEAGGRLLAKAPEVHFMTAADFAPEVKAAGAGERVFELRTYKSSAGNLDALLARFREHTLK